MGRSPDTAGFDTPSASGPNDRLCSHSAGLGSPAIPGMAPVHRYALNFAFDGWIRCGSPAMGRVPHAGLVDRLCSHSAGNALPCDCRYARAFTFRLGARAVPPLMDLAPIGGYRYPIAFSDRLRVGWATLDILLQEYQGVCNVPRQSLINH